MEKKFALEKKDWRNFAFWQLFCTKKSYFSKIILTLIFATGATIYLFWRVPQIPIWQLFQWFAIFCGGIFFYIFAIQLLVIFFRLFFLSRKKWEIFFEKQNWKFTPEKIFFVGQKGSSELNWNFFQKFSETKNYFFLFVTPIAAHIFPKKIFEKNEIAEFRALLQQKFLKKND